MSQTAWLVALSAIAVVSAILSFVAWSRLAHPPRDLLPADGADDQEIGGEEAAEGEAEDAPEPEEASPGTT